MNNAWNGFTGGDWQNEINVRDFIQKNYTPYEGDGAFLAPATARTTKMREKFDALLAEERERAVYAISTPRPLSRLRPSARATSTRKTRSSSACRPTSP